MFSLSGFESELIAGPLVCDFGGVSGEVLESIELEIYFTGEREKEFLYNRINTGQSLKFILLYEDLTPVSAVGKLCASGGSPTTYDIESGEVTIPIDKFTAGDWFFYIEDQDTKTGSQVFAFEVKDFC